MTKLNVKLIKDNIFAQDIFLKLKDGQDVADFFEIKYGQLLFLLYHQPDEKKYSSFTIPKKNGSNRIILKPSRGINILQRKLKPILEFYYKVKAPVHGFVKTKSIVTNASKHLKRRYVLNIDLLDFFGSINFGRVRGLFMNNPFCLGEKAASILAQLLCFQNKLPQGACTSPVISNFIASRLDSRLLGLAEKNHCLYTRYADDITFSCNKKIFPRALAYYEGDNPINGNTIIGKLLEHTINQTGFEVNHSKVRLQIPCIRQEVTGITINEFANTKRKFVKQIRAMLHAWEKFGPIDAESEYINRYSKKKIDIPREKQNGSYFLNVFYGKLSYLKMVRCSKGKYDDIVYKFAYKARQLHNDPPHFVGEILKMKKKFDIFIGHAGEDKAKVARPIYEECNKKGIKAFFDEEHINWGDSLVKEIDDALKQSSFFLAILSKNSLNKQWPKKELMAAIAREMSNEQKLLPLIVGNTEEVLQEVPLLQDKRYIKWKGNVSEVVETLKSMIYTNRERK